MGVPAEREQRGEDCARRLIANTSTPEQLSSMGFSKECVSAGQLIAGGRDPKALANVSLEIVWLTQCCTDQMDLSSRSLVDADGSALGKLMSETLFVTVLNVSNNKLGAGAAKDIARALESNGTITSLDLSKNDFGPDGVITIASGLKSGSITSVRRLVFSVLLLLFNCSHFC
jgi:hypothetical protein